MGISRDTCPNATTDYISYKFKNFSPFLLSATSTISIPSAAKVRAEASGRAYTLTLTTEGVTDGALLRLLERGRYHLLGDSKVLSEVCDALGGEAIVEPAPVEGLLDVTTATEALKKRQHLDVRHRQLLAVCTEDAIVFLGNTCALLEKVAIYREAVLLCNKHLSRLLRCVRKWQSRSQTALAMTLN